MTASPAPLTPETLKRIRSLAGLLRRQDIAAQLGWDVEKLDRVCRDRGIDLSQSVSGVHIERPHIGKTFPAQEFREKFAQRKANARYDYLTVAMTRETAERVRAAAAHRDIGICRLVAHLMDAVVKRELFDDLLAESEID